MNNIIYNDKWRTSKYFYACCVALTLLGKFNNKISQNVNNASNIVYRFNEGFDNENLIKFHELILKLYSFYVYHCKVMKNEITN